MEPAVDNVSASGVMEEAINSTEAIDGDGNLTDLVIEISVTESVVYLAEFALNGAEEVYLPLIQ